jgi:hypothetical protein
MEEPTGPKSGRLKSLARILTVFILTAIAGVVVLTLWPGLGASVARPLRNVIGNERVAQLETVLFTVQDVFQQGSYGLGLAEPEAPWVVEVTSTPPAPTRPAPTITPSSTPKPTATNDLALPTSAAILLSPTPTNTPTPTANPTAVPWTLPALSPYTDLSGEGVWQPYLYNSTGDVVGLRTFLLPDPDRPYATVAIVAFDLKQTSLHYVLGVDEPKLPDGPGGSGTIPTQDKQPDQLLAAFNGGFMATHGEYGAMSNGTIALPAKIPYGTVAIYENGDIQIGEWGSDILPDGAFAGWRQNARMVVHNGQINERVYNGSIITWGGNINGDIVTWRSGVGISADQQTLYYLAGPSISMPTLAEAMMASGAYNGILLDINASWVHFTAIRPNDIIETAMTAEPLFEEGMETHTDRYLNQSSRDFFYITAK